MLIVIETFTVLAYQYAPFFFAVWFTGYITRWAYRIYNTAPTASHRKTYRWYFAGTSAFSIILVLASIIWWFINPPSMFIFKGQIKGLKDYEKITSSSLHFRPHLLRRLEENAPQLRNEHFLITRDKRFREEDEFDILFSKGEGRQHELSLRYYSEPNPRYKIKWDSVKKRTVLEKVSSSASSLDLFIRTAYAEEEKIHPTRKIRSLPTGATALRPADRKLIEQLQSERTDVGTKISLIERLDALDDKTLPVYLEATTAKEPFILTLMDLSRHTDEELAHKAKALVIDRFDFSSFVTAGLSSPDEKIQKNITTLIFRMDPKQAKFLLTRIPKEVKIPSKELLMKEISEGYRSRVLIPTGSSQGDRYYVQASWNPEETKVVDCLTKLFNRELISNRTLEQETALMKGRNKRFVYWYSREWALYIYDKVEQCGANATFVNGITFK